LYNTKWFAICSVQEEKLAVAPRRALYLPVFLIASAFLAVAQGQKPQQPPAEKPPEAPKVLPNSVNADTPEAAIDPKSYLIGAEDVLFVTVFHEQELTRAVSVRPDGKITMPLIGDMQAEGLTPERFGAQLKQALSTFVKNPDVTIAVSQVNSKRYTISGEVMRPGLYPLVVPTKVFDALSPVGFRDFARRSKIIIIRGSERIKFNYDEVLKGKKLEQNIFLQPGDTIHVP
jgi:polysaccharide export outer membrane protein